MPPQPLKKYRTAIELAPEVLHSRPALALRIAKIASIASHLQMQLGLLLAALLRTEAKAAVAMYLSLSGARPQEAILTGAAKHRLSGPDFTALERLMKDVVKPATKGRISVVHRMWGATDEFPDMLIAVDPNELAADLADRAIPPPKKRQDAMYAGSGGSPPKLMKWKERDFIEVEDRLNDALRQVSKFTALVLRKYPAR